MEFTDAREWLDALIANAEERRNLTYFNNQIRAMSEPGYIQIYTGLDILSDLLGVELEEEILKGSEYPYCYYFIYRGIKICQVTRGRMITGAGTD